MYLYNNKKTCQGQAKVMSPSSRPGDQRELELDSNKKKCQGQAKVMSR